MTFLSSPPHKKKKHSWQATAEDSPPTEGTWKNYRVSWPNKSKAVPYQKKNKCGCEKPPFTLLYSGDIGCICAIGIFDEHWMYWMDLANSEVHSSVVSYWAWWSWEVSSYPFQKTKKNKHYYCELFFTIFTSSALKSPLSPPRCRIFAKWPLWGSLPAQEPRHEGVPARFADVPRTPVAAFLDESWWIMDINSDQLWFMVGRD